MSRWFQLACLLSLTVLSQGCSRYLKTQELSFSRNATAIGGNPIAVDIIFPRTIEEREQLVKEFDADPNKWFNSEYYIKNKMMKEKDDVPAGNVVTHMIQSGHRPRKEIGLIIIAEFGQRSGEASPTEKQRSIIVLHKESDPKPRKKELIYIDQGYMERR